jgi:hypothetical protein
MNAFEFAGAMRFSESKVLVDDRYWTVFDALGGSAFFDALMTSFFQFFQDASMARTYSLLLLLVLTCSRETSSLCGCDALESFLSPWGRPALAKYTPNLLVYSKHGKLSYEPHPL